MDRKPLRRVIGLALESKKVPAKTSDWYRKRIKQLRIKEVQIQTRIIKLKIKHMLAVNAEAHGTTPSED